MRYQHIGVASLRALNGKKLKELTEPIVVHSHATPIAAVVPYQLYLEWQDFIKRSHAYATEPRT